MKRGQELTLARLVNLEPSSPDQEPSFLDLSCPVTWLTSTLSSRSERPCFAGSALLAWSQRRGFACAWCADVAPLLIPAKKVQTERLSALTCRGSVLSLVDSNLG